MSPPISLEEACPDTRWIAVLAEQRGACPNGPVLNGGRWAGSQLFASTRGPWPLPSGLTPFCAYDWESLEGAPPSPQEVEALRMALSPDIERMDPDCHTVAPMGTSTTTQAAWQTLHADFHAQIGRLALLPMGNNPPPEQVRVAVVDSSPYGESGGEAVEDQLGHGYAMGRFIRELGCPDGSPVCIAQVANHLALPLVKPGEPDLTHGGYFGNQTQLARAIHSAVSDWRSHNAQGGTAAPQPHLVINLSLAWDGRFGGPYPNNAVEELPAPVRAVHAAITHAVCREALVIAAAGNDPGGPDEVTGPMFPAAWEQKPAPARETCECLEGQGSQAPGAQCPAPLPGGGLYQPLVFAVGGVRGDDQPLASTRLQGRPRTAAPGAHAVASDVDTSGNAVPTDVLTGTSVSTAVVSGIAATIWGYRPELSGFELMELVRQASVDLGTPADFCLGGTPCPWSATDPRRSIRRVSLCRALQTACAAGAGRCPPPSAIPACPSRPEGSLPKLTPDEMAEINLKLERVDGSVVDVALPPLAVCQQTALRTMSWRYDETVCPFRQYYGIPLRPWTNPQPSKNPCTLCMMELHTDTNPDPTATVYISIDSEFSARELYDPSLLVNGVYEIDLSELLERQGKSRLTAGDDVKVTDILLDPAWLPIHSAALTLRGEEANASYSTFSELLLQ